MVGKTKQAMLMVQHFPIINRLRQMFTSLALAELMTWHKKNCSRDNLQRHVEDCKAWEKVERSNLKFAVDPQNIWLGLVLMDSTPLETCLPHTHLDQFSCSIIIYRLGRPQKYVGTTNSRGKRASG